MCNFDCVVLCIKVTRCHHLEPPLNGHINSTAVDYDVTVGVACNDGYVFTSGNVSMTTTCMHGNWTNSFDGCIGMNSCLINRPTQKGYTNYF